MFWLKLFSHLPERTRGRPWGRLRVRIRSIDKTWSWKFILLHKISRTACCFGIRTFLKQYNCYESATIWYTDHQYLAQYSEIINNLQEIPLIFYNYAVRSCGTWRKGPVQFSSVQWYPGRRSVLDLCIQISSRVSYGREGTWYYEVSICWARCNIYAS